MPRLTLTVLLDQEAPRQRALRFQTDLAARLRRIGWLTLLPLALSSTATAQTNEADQASADPTLYPELVRVERHATGVRYVNRVGRTLYAPEAGQARFRKGTTIEYCVAACTTAFTPILAREDAMPIGLWKPARIASGLVWTYRGVTVYTFNGDKPGETRGEGYEGIFHTIEYTPREPEVLAPNGTDPVYHKGRWFLAGKDRRILFTRPTGEVLPSLADAEPLSAGLSAGAFGAWSIHGGRDRLQWAYQGRPVFVAAKSGFDLAPELGEPIILKGK